MIVPAYGDVTSLKTDKSVYSIDDKIVFSGTSNNPGEIVNLAIKNPFGNTVEFRSGVVNSTGHFSLFPITVDNQIFDKPGTFEVIAFGNTQQVQNGIRLTLDFSNGKITVLGSSQSPADCGPNQVFQLGFCQDIHEPTTTITVSTDRSSYKTDDIIRISGNVGEILSGYIVYLQVTAPSGNSVFVQELDVSYTRFFGTNLDTGGSFWQSSGTYIVEVFYGTAAITSSTTFYFQSSQQPSPEDCGPNQVFQLGFCQDIAGTFSVDMPAGTSVPGCEETNQCFIPATININVGGAVQWTNSDTAAHTVTSGTVANGPDGVFDSSLFMAETTFIVKFDEAGEFPYHCMVHPWMVGTVIVGGTAPPPPPPTVFDDVPPLIIVPEDIVVNATASFGAAVTFSVKGIDNVDGILSPQCDMPSGSTFPIGETKVVCSAFDSSGNSASNSFLVTVESPDVLIPAWVRDVAAFWCDDEIDDSGFIQAIQYLIDNDVIVVPETQEGSGGTQVIPSWIKNNACWWSAGLISDSDFAQGIQYLIQQGIIKI